MARQKQKIPLQRAPSSEIMQPPPDLPEPITIYQNGHSESKGSVNGTKKLSDHDSSSESGPSFVQLAVCVAGIYASL